jgi:hypothetical protein
VLSLSNATPIISLARKMTIWKRRPYVISYNTESLKTSKIIAEKQKISAKTIDIKYK